MDFVNPFIKARGEIEIARVQLYFCDKGYISSQSRDRALRSSPAADGEEIPEIGARNSKSSRSRFPA